MCASLPTHYADQNKVHVDILGGVAFVYLLSTWSCGQGGGGGSNLGQIWSMQLLNAPLMALIMCTWYIFFTQ